MSELNDGVPNQENSKSGAIGAMLAWVFVTLALMAFFITYEGPSGQRIGFWGFVLFWFKELFFLGLAIFLLGAVAIEKIQNRSRPRSDNSETSASGR